MEKALRDKKAILFFTLPGLLWYVLIAIIPVTQSFSYSFLSWNGINTPRIVGLANYQAMFTSPLFYKSVANSLILAGASIFIQIPICMVLALVLAKGVQGEKFYRTVYFIPVIISSTIIAQLWAKIYHPNYGLLNTFLDRIGQKSLQQLWLADPKFALGAVFVPMIWQYIGYHMLLFYSATKTISPEVLDAAHVDGATEFQIAVRIIIPMIMSMIKAAVIFALIGSLKSFDMIYILTRGGPLHTTSVPTMMMYNEIFTNSRYGPASAIAIFTVLECLVLTMLVQWIFKCLQGKD